MTPFIAQCREGETYRYDNGKGEGANIWQAEDWGDWKIIWLGEESIMVGGVEAKIVYAANGVISAAWLHESKFFGKASNVYSFVIDTIMGQAVISQVQSVVGAIRQIKVHSQNLHCKVTWLK